ncbi:hypothetical protein HDU96_010464 [Phlyctochytrium bullatum]|nr:hypothetical protein HDU96_010464 [Phlyctochytrium bullatum]
MRFPQLFSDRIAIVPFLLRPDVLASFGFVLTLAASFSYAMSEDLERSFAAARLLEAILLVLAISLNGVIYLRERKFTGLEMGARLHGILDEVAVFAANYNPVRDAKPA